MPALTRPLGLASLLLLTAASSCGSRTELRASAHTAPGAPPAGTVAAAPPTAAPPTALAELRDGPHLYNKYCALCHGPAAQGYAADNAPSLVSSTFVATASDAFVRTAIERGRPGTAMGGYGALVGGPLSREELDTLTAWIKQLAPAPPVALSDERVRGSARHGRDLFQKNCVVCHGTELQRGNAVHLFNGVLLATASDAFLRHAIVNGRPGTKMEPWKDKLPPHAIDDLVAYLRKGAPRDLPAALARFAPSPAANAAMGSSTATAVATGQEAARPLKGPLIVNPRGQQASFTLKDDRLVPMEQVKAALDAGRRLVFVDARTPSDWDRLHIQGAISIPYYDMKAIEKLPNDGTWIIAYCACPHHASGVVFDELRRRGYKTSAVLDEGVFAWQQKGYPVVAAPGSLPIPAPPPMPSPVAQHPGAAPSGIPMPMAAPTPTTPPRAPH